MHSVSKTRRSYKNYIYFGEKRKKSCKVHSSHKTVYLNVESKEVFAEVK